MRDTLNVTQAHDLYLYETVVRRKIEKPKSSSGGSSSFTSSAHPTAVRRQAVTISLTIASSPQRKATGMICAESNWQDSQMFQQIFVPPTHEHTAACQLRRPNRAKPAPDGRAASEMTNVMHPIKATDTKTLAFRKARASPLPAHQCW